MEPLWYRNAVIYQMHVRSFSDSNGDGIGDFQGVISKLDYMEELGVTAIWLLPFYPSPLRDDGYDIADYTSVNPSYGTIQDVRRFIDEAHRRSDPRHHRIGDQSHVGSACLVPSRASKSPKGSPARDFYVWSDTPEKYAGARIIFKDFEPSNWTFDREAGQYYWHRFFHHQPDLNFDNPAVHEAVLQGLRFLDGRGRGWRAARRGALPVRARGNKLRKSRGNSCVSEERCASTSTPIGRANAAGRGESVAGGRHRLFRERRR